jgi:hypothetical protein
MLDPCVHGETGPVCAKCDEEEIQTINNCEADGGHVWEDHSYANSECGNVHLVCKSCGFDYLTWLY